MPTLKHHLLLAFVVSPLTVTHGGESASSSSPSSSSSSASSSTPSRASAAAQDREQKVTQQRDDLKPYDVWRKKYYEPKLQAYTNQYNRLREHGDFLEAGILRRPLAYGAFVQPESGTILFAATTKANGSKYPLSAGELETLTGMIRDTEGYRGVLAEDTMRRAASYAAFAQWVLAYQGRPKAIRAVYTKLSEQAAADAAKFNKLTDKLTIDRTGSFIELIAKTESTNELFCEYLLSRDKIANLRGLKTPAALAAEKAAAMKAE